MTNLSTFTIRFYVQKGKPKPDGRVPVFCRITVNRDACAFSLKTHIAPERWSSEEGRALGFSKEDKEMNRLLDDYRALMKSSYNDLLFRGEVVTAEKVKRMALGMDDTKYLLLELCDKFIEDYSQLVGTGEVTRTTYQRYVLTRERLSEFILNKYRMSDIPVADINHSFIKGFDLHNRTEHTAANNTAVRFIKHFRTMFNLARNNGWVSTDPFATYKVQMEKVNRGYLTQEEVNAIITKEFTNRRLDVVKDMFLFSVFTGLAYIDVRELTLENILFKDDGTVWIDTTRHKTNNVVQVQLLDIPRMIIEKYRDKGKKGRLLPIPCNQKVNDYLKEIAAICNIEKNLSYHLARHTFATTITLENGVPIETVSKMLGHSSIKTTQIYARITQRKIGQDMNNLAKVLQGKVSQAAIV